MSKNVKKLRALQVTALLSAVSGATLIMSASSPVQAAEESCWEPQRVQQNGVVERERNLRGCAYNQYGLDPGLRPGDGQTDPAGTGPETGGGGGGGGTGPDTGGGGEYAN